MDKPSRVSEQVILTSADQLQHCESEDIRHPEMVQAIGAVLVVDGQTGYLLRWSENTEQLLGLKGLKEGLNLSQAMPAIGAALSASSRSHYPSEKPRHIGTIETSGRGDSGGLSSRVELLEHFATSGTRCRIIECLPLDDSSNSENGQIEPLLEAIRVIEATTHLDDLLQKSATAVQAFSKYDRVMLYRFDDDWHGEIVAEACEPSQSLRFLGQHFPASDIPAQARTLYERNLLRIIGDVNADPARLLPTKPEKQHLDQSFCLLRAPSPFHLDYLKNMGVGATLTVSIIVDGKLWGMLSCHHGTPRTPPYHVRYTLLMAMEVLGRMIARQVENLSRIQTAENQLDFVQRLKAIEVGLEKQDNVDENGYLILLEFLKQWFDASHATLFMAGARFGDALTPEAEGWLVRKANDGTGPQSTCKASLWPECRGLVDTSSIGGVAFGPIKNFANCCLIMARPMLKFSRVWAGRPDSYTTLQTRSGDQVLGARRSFALWREEVQDQSAPWPEGWEKCLEGASNAITDHYYRIRISNQQEQAKIVGKALETMPDFVLITWAEKLAPSGHRPITYANPALCDATGYTEKELLGQSADIFQGEGTDRTELARISAALKEFKPVVATLKNYTKSGSPYWIEIKIVPIFGKAGEATHFVSVQRDITEQRALEAQVLDRERAMTAILDTIPEILVDLDPNGLINTVYSGNHNLFGQPLNAFTGKTLAEALTPEISDQLLASVEQAQKQDLEFDAPGDYGFYLARIAAKKTGSSNQHAGYVCSLTNISERRKAQEQAQYRSEHDSLTGLLNRAGLKKHLDELSLISDQHVAALFIDLDRFKTINDVHGHKIGDSILCEVASRIRSSAAKSHIISRIGGDEFIVLVTAQANHSEAVRKAETCAISIRSAIAAPYWLGGISYEIDCSIGIAVSDDVPDYHLDLMACSDLAMYTAKKEGGGRIQIFERSMHEIAQQHHRLETDLSNTLRTDSEGLELHYQPIVKDVEEIVGYEALIRWNHCDFGPISPADFIPVAEQSSLIVELGNWVLAKACATLAEWSRIPANKHLVLSINISALQIQQPTFVDQVLACLRQADVRPQNLKLEITETLLQYDLDDTIEKMRQLKEAGLQCSLDDFGTGFSSLSYLQKLPIDEVKIDLQFVQAMRTDPNAEAIVKLIISLAQTLELRVVAEGVESREEWGLLKQLGCHYFQGYHFGRPQAKTVDSRPC